VRPALLASILAAGVCLAPAHAARESAAPGEEVVLLHGLARTDRSLRPLEKRLSAAGFWVHNLRYPSTELGPEALVAHLHQQLAACCAGAPRLHFVTHSLGGILVRAYLAEHALENLGRVVMLAPPNQGSELAAALQALPPYHWIGGPAAGEIAAGPPFAALPDGLEVAVIAGGTADGRGFNPLLSDNNDGIVTVAETALPDARDRMTVNAVHTVIAAAPETIAATLKFLESGRLR